jgi:hypothetical protein
VLHVQVCKVTMSLFLTGSITHSASGLTTNA